MLLRVLALVAFVAAGLAGPASAQDWKNKVAVVGFGSVSTENQAATQTRFKEVANAFKEKTGVEMRVYTANDYAGTIQALTGGHIHMAQLGGSGYASAWIDSNGNVEPLVANKEVDGALGYHSILIVKADSRAKRLEDLGWA
jgi:phosphonate transport system substrate-binding protein